MLRTAAVFSNHMVLQQKKKLRIFGTADEGSRITVTLLGQQAEAVCRGGKWMAYLPEFEAAEGAELTVTDGRDTLHFTDIAIGEVWLAGGQSNMELELQNVDGGPEILKNGPKDNEAWKRVRFYYTPKVAYECEALYEAESNSTWELFDEQTAAKWSAAGFFFAAKLAEKLNVTVGVIGCNWGGTSASCWMSREALLEQEATRIYVDEYDNNECVKKPLEEQIKEYEDYLVYHADWERRANEIYAVAPYTSWDEIQEKVGICKYPGPMNGANFARPCGLHEVMLQRVAPYTLRGFLFYQGENDAFRCNSYYALLSRMILQWREDFEDLSLPFLMVQLPMHRYQHEEDTKEWCIIREAQMKTYETVRNTGIAVIIDCGQFHEIHPKNKKPVGERLAMQALYQVYHLAEEKEAFGPVFQDYLYRDGGMEIHFSHAQDGFTLKGELSGFELAGEDGVFCPAEAVLGKETVFLQAKEVAHPVMARYLWTNFGEVTLFGANGLPAAPFRTHLF